MTVEDLIAILEEFPKDAPLLLTGCYGAITDGILGASLIDGKVHISSDLMTG